ncbi:MAG: hypothetical protein ACM3MK_13995 [Chitinophagales bacterium]
MTDTEFAPFEVKLIIRNPRAVDTATLMEKTQTSMASFAKIRLENLQLKKYGLKASGTAPLQDVIRITENMYTLTSEGGMEIVITVGKREKFLIKEGRVHDLSDPKTGQIPIPLDEAEPTEEDLSRIGF